MIWPLVGFVAVILNIWQLAGVVNRPSDNAVNTARLHPATETNEKARSHHGTQLVAECGSSLLGSS